MAMAVAAIPHVTVLMVSKSFREPEKFLEQK